MRVRACLPIIHFSILFVCCAVDVQCLHCGEKKYFALVEQDVGAKLKDKHVYGNFTFLCCMVAHKLVDLEAGLN